MHKIFSNLNKIAKIHISFTNPPKSPVLALESEEKRSGILTKMVLNDIEHFNLYCNSQEFYFTPQILFWMIINIKFIRTFKSQGFSYLGSFMGLNILACINYIDPKVILTFIDNSLLFQLLLMIYKKATSYVIQNATRLEWDVDVKWKFNIMNFYCFGYFEKELYEKYHHNIDYYYPAGSLIGGYYSTEIADVTTKNMSFDICLVSQWRSMIMIDDLIFPESKESNNKMNEFLSKFVSKNNISICIATCTTDIREYEYYRSFYGMTATIVEFNQKQFSTYDAMNRSSIIINLNSTAAVEAFGWGKKVLFVNFTGSNIIPMPEICSMSDGNYQQFERKVNSLKEMSKEVYQDYIKKYIPYFMNYNFEKPLHRQIREKVLSHLS